MSEQCVVHSERQVVRSYDAWKSIRVPRSTQPKQQGVRRGRHERGMAGTRCPAMPCAPLGQAGAVLLRTDRNFILSCLLASKVLAYVHVCECERVQRLPGCHSGRCIKCRQHSAWSLNSRMDIACSREPSMRTVWETNAALSFAWMLLFQWHRCCRPR